MGANRRVRVYILRNLNDCGRIKRGILSNFAEEYMKTVCLALKSALTIVIKSKNVYRSFNMINLKIYDMKKSYYASLSLA